MQREHIVFPEERQEEAMITPRHLAPHLWSKDMRTFSFAIVTNMTWFLFIQAMEMEEYLQNNAWPTSEKKKLKRKGPLYLISTSQLAWTTRQSISAPECPLLSPPFCRLHLMVMQEFYLSPTVPSWNPESALTCTSTNQKKLPPSWTRWGNETNKRNPKNSAVLKR
jgi:hypothetical protein